MTIEGREIQHNRNASSDQAATFSYTYLAHEKSPSFIGHAYTMPRNAIQTDVDRITAQNQKALH